MNTRKILMASLVTVLAALVTLSAIIITQTSCGGNYVKNSDEIQRMQQEAVLRDITQQTGMPAIKNAREKRMLKDIYELRDQTGLATFTYVYNDMKGCAVFFGNSIGYGIPYATQYTAPQKAEWIGAGSGHMERGFLILPQADPNGLFSPATAEGTWVLLKDPGGPSVLPVYIEPRVIVSQFKLADTVVCR